MTKVIKNFKELRDDVKPLKWNTYTFIDSTIEIPKHKSWISIYYIVDRTPQPESVIHVMARFSNISKDDMEKKYQRQIVLRITDFPMFRDIK